MPSDRKARVKLMRQTHYNEAGRYQLRAAAGRYWLLDMDQEGVPFQKPILINRMGALIWTMVQDGEEDQIAGRLCEEYQVSEEQVARDVDRFREELRRRGVSI